MGDGRPTTVLTSGSVGMGIPTGIPMGIPVGMGWVWGLKCHPHGSTAFTFYPNQFTVYNTEAHIRERTLTNWNYKLQIMVIRLFVGVWLRKLSLQFLSFCHFSRRRTFGIVVRNKD